MHGLIQVLCAVAITFYSIDQIYILAVNTYTFRFISTHTFMLIIVRVSDSMKSKSTCKNSVQSLIMFSNINTLYFILFIRFKNPALAHCYEQLKVQHHLLHELILS